MLPAWAENEGLGVASFTPVFTLSCIPFRLDGGIIAGSTIREERGNTAVCTRFSSKGLCLKMDKAT